jgi:hypothetical protein
MSNAIPVLQICLNPPCSMAAHLGSESKIPPSPTKSRCSCCICSTCYCSVKFREFFSSSSPVILRQKRGTRPDISLICSLLDDHSHHVRVYKPKYYSNADVIQREVTETRMLFREYLQALKTGEAQKQDMYWAMYSPELEAHQSQLEEAVRLASVERFLGIEIGDSKLHFWLGPPGHREQLHYDDAANFHMQISGRKQWSLFPPTCLTGLYPVPVSHSIMDRPNYSQVDIDLPDYAAFPALEKALNHRQDVILETGDVLFLPERWWHQVSGLPGSSSLDPNTSGALPELVCSANRFLPLRERIYLEADATSVQPSQVRTITVRVMVPPNAEAGDVLTFLVQGQEIEFPVPEGCQPGEVCTRSLSHAHAFASLCT